jgi:hypothetical protein
MRVRRKEPLPDAQELIKGLRRLFHSLTLYETPAMDTVGRYRDQISHWLEEEDMTAKQIWRLLKEEHELKASYCNVKHHLKREFNVGAPKVTVRI